MHNVKVQAVWDDEARVWVAESKDVPGLATGASTLEQLILKLETLVPELLEINQLPHQVGIQLDAHRDLVAAF